MRAGALALCLASCALAAGCFRQRQEDVTTDSVSYLALEGPGAPVTLLVDGSVIAEGIWPSRGTRYKLARGSHEVQVLRKGRTIVQRKVYIGDGETRVLSVPAD